MRKLAALLLFVLLGLIAYAIYTNTYNVGAYLNDFPTPMLISFFAGVIVKTLIDWLVGKD